MGLFMEMNVTELESGGLAGPLLTGEIELNRENVSLLLLLKFRQNAIIEKS